jgi:hypothetical protein
MLAHPYGLPRLVDPRMAMQFVPQSEDSKLKRQQPIMMLNPYDMVNVDQQRQLQTRMLQQQLLQSRTHQHNILQQHQQQQQQAAQQQQRRQPKAKPSKRVIAINLPSNLHTIESVTTTFYPYGEILLVRVLRPGKQLPFDLKQYQPKIPDLAKTVCAIIEFEAADAAKFAVQTLRFRTKELGFRLALLEGGAEEDLYGPIAEPQLPMLKPGQAAPGITDESGIELSGSGRSSSSDRDSHSDCEKPSPKTNRKDRIRAPSSASESETERNIKLTEKWNPNVQEFVPGNFGSPKKSQPISTTATVAVNNNGRIVTSVSISLSKPTKGRQTSKIALVPTTGSKPGKKTETIQYTRDFLLSLRSTKESLEAPKMAIEVLEEEFKRYTPPQRRNSQPVQPTVQAPIQLAPQRRNSHLRR